MLDKKEIQNRIENLSSEDREKLFQEITQKMSGLDFIPNPGAQTLAYFSPAFETLYGGSAGGGKSGLLLGLAFNEHKRSLIMRREGTQHAGLIDDAKRLFGHKADFVGGNKPKATTKDGKLIEFRGAKNIGDEDKMQGVPHDLLAFDEVVHFAESQYKFLHAWVRSVDKGQRCRIIAASNPPVGSQGDWVIRRWAPWLDPTYPNPAKQGELRWFVTTPDGEDMEVSGPNPILFPGQSKPVTPKSRTFIGAKYTDNPYINPDYKSTLDALPEPMRSAMRDGNFMAARTDDANQLIPIQWVRDAFERWESMKQMVRGIPLSSMGVDVCSPGGGDAMVIAKRYDGWFDNFTVVEGRKLKTEADIAGHILKEYRDGAPIVLDMGGGYGGATKLQLNSSGIKVVDYKGVSGTSKRSRLSNVGFPNTRSAAYWMLREALDPSQPGGSHIAFPRDRELEAELTAPTFELTSQGFKVETKESVREKLGRSPNKADAVVMSYFEGQKGMLTFHPGQAYPEGRVNPNGFQRKINVVTSKRNDRNSRRR